MKIEDLVKSLSRYDGISCDSKEAKKNFIFVAIKGTCLDGHDFITEAAGRGASVVVAEKGSSVPALPPGIDMVVVPDSRRALAELAAEFYGHPSRKIKTIGVTGTNGKTTVTYLIEAILAEAGKTPAVLGTINYRFKGQLFPSENTTPGPLRLQAIFARMLAESVDYAVLEVSSHALDQDRTRGVDFSSAVFTNLTQDHLDYHKNLKNYFAAKSRLFRGLSRASLAVLNCDDACGRRLKKMTKAKIFTYGIKTRADVIACRTRFALDRTEFVLRAAGEEIALRTHLIGRHNIYNILAAASWARAEGIALGVIKNAVEKFRLVPGRLERLDCPRGFSVFVDYAHTEDALKNILLSLKQLALGRIIVVFGCGGQRDKTKRPKMAAVVSRLSDYAIITNDNPRGEDPKQIIADILRGMRKNNYRVIPGRAEAIKESLSLARRGDIVLVAGKGHEDYQIIGGRKLHFDDREVIRECLRSMN